MFGFGYWVCFTKPSSESWPICPIPVLIPVLPWFTWNISRVCLTCVCFEFSASVELDKYNGMRAKEIIQIICSKTKSQHFYSTCKSQFAVLYKWLTLDEQQIGSRYFQKVRGGPEKVFSWLKQRHHQKGGWPSCTAALAGHRHSPTTHLPVWIQLAANIICVTL